MLVKLLTRKAHTYPAMQTNKKQTQNAKRKTANVESMNSFRGPKANALVLAIQHVMPRTHTPLFW